MSRLSKNILYNLLGQGLLLVLGFVAVKYVFAQLGEDALGIIFFTATMSAVLCAVLELGICSTTVREVSAHFKDEPAYIRDLIGTASLFYWGAYALLALTMYWGVPVIVEKWINLKTMDAGTATRMLQVLGVAALLALPRSLYASLLRGLERMEFNNLIDVATSGLQQFGTILILVLGGGVLDVVYWLALCFALGLMGYVLVSARFLSFRALVPRYSGVVVQRNLSYSSNMMSISLLSMAHMQTDKVLVSKLLSIGTFGIYAFASGVVSRATLLTGAISQAAFPSLSALFRRGGRSSFMSQYRQLHDLVCFLMMPVFAAIVFAGEPLFTYLLDAETAQTLLLPVVFLCLGFYMNGTLNVPYVASLAMGKPQITVRLNLYALFIIVPLTAVLVYFFGITGAGLSWVAYHVFAYAYAIPRICAQCLGFPAAEWYRHILRIVALTGATYGTAWMVLEALGIRTIPYLALAYVVASMLFVAGTFRMMGEELRGTFQRSLQALRIRSAEVFGVQGE